MRLTPVNLTHCCIQHTSRSFWYLLRYMCRSIFSLSKIAHQMIAYGVITYSAKETGQQKEQWGRGLEVIGK